MMAHVGSERGAVLVHVAAALATFTLLSAFVVDLGMLLVSRHQIQNAADAAALAAATALSLDSYTNRDDGGPAKRAALAVAQANLVWKEAPRVAAADVTFPVCADSWDISASAQPKYACVQVDAFRDEAHGNPLPSVFGQLMGIPSVNIAATATAETKEGNATDCLKPLAIPDRWSEKYPAAGAWNLASTFDKWNPSAPTVELTPEDLYEKPTATASGTGLTLSAEFGTQVVLKPGSVATPVSPISPWKYLPVQIPGSVFGANDVLSNINHCAKSTIRIGDALNLVTGSVSGTVAAGMKNLIDLDPTANWDIAHGWIDNSCANAKPRCASMSPRIIALAVYDPIALADRSVAGATNVVVANLIGFFVESVVGTDVTGRIVRHPGLIKSDAPVLTDDSSFLRASLLVK
jgi:hypothetical protein